MGSQYLSAYPSMDRNTPEARARAATMGYDNSAGNYEDEVARARSARDEALGQATRTRTAADSAIADYSKPGGAPPLAGWKPTAMTAYAPTQMAQWMSGVSRPAPPSALPQMSAPQGRVAPSDPSGFQSRNLAAFDDSALESFDPSQAGTTFAKGAYGDFKRGLDLELNDLTNRSVGAGRYRTGLFDEDQGRVVTGLGQAFEDKIAQQAGVFSGQRLDALKSGAGYRLQRAGEMDTNARSVYEQNQELQRRAAEQDAQDALAHDKLNLEGYGLETDRYRTEGGFYQQAGALAQSADELAYRRAHDTDAMTYDQAARLTDVGENRARTGLESSLGRERTYLDEYDRSQDRATSAVSGSRDWAARDRELEDLRAEIAAIRQSQGLGKYGVTDGRVGGGASTALDDSPAAVWAKSIAKANGVPYKG